MLCTENYVIHQKLRLKPVNNVRRTNVLAEQIICQKPSREQHGDSLMHPHTQSREKILEVDWMIVEKINAGNYMRVK